MDCRKALEILDLARVELNETGEAALGVARAHLQSCRRCEETLRDHQRLDLQISETMRDVQVPLTLRQRLLDAVAVEQATVDQHLTDTTVDVDVLSDNPVVRRAPRTGIRQGRQRWFTFSLTVACLCVAVGWLIFQTSTPSLTLADIHEMLPVDTESKLPKFDGNFVAKPPQRGWEELLIRSDAKGLRANDSGKHIVAVFGFRFRNNRRSLVNGTLLVIPVDAVIDPPNEHFFAREAVVYLPDGSATVTWVSDGLLYVCCLPGGGHDLSMLERVLEGAPA